MSASAPELFDPVVHLHLAGKGKILQLPILAIPKSWPRYPEQDLRESMDEQLAELEANGTIIWGEKIPEK